MYLSLLILLSFTFTVGQKQAHGHLLWTCCKSGPRLAVSVGKELFLVLSLNEWRGPCTTHECYFYVNKCSFVLALPHESFAINQSSDPNPATSQHRTLNRYLWPRQSTYHWCLVWLARSTKSFILALSTYPEIWLLCVDTEINTFPTICIV